MSVLDKFLAGEMRSLSRLVSFVEHRESGYRQLLARLHGHAGHSLRIGLTGPPGAGKSVLVSALARLFLADKKKVGVIAVDPTSPFTGGALLGDRVRMDEFPTDGSFYFRSMATRGASGGLASATDNVGAVYDSFGFDITLIETVGVGQVELDIVDTCDSVIVVLVPESGDSVQTLKAGLMEIADLFCVNKADRPGAERIVSELQLMLDTRKKVAAAWEPSIVTTEAINNKNTTLLHDSILKHIQFIRDNGQFEKHRRLQIKKKILNLLKNRFQREFLEKLSLEMAFEQIIDDIWSGKTSPFEIGDELYDEFRSA